MNLLKDSKIDFGKSAGNAVPVIHLPDSWNVKSWEWKGEPQAACPLCGFLPDLPNRLFSNFQIFHEDELTKAVENGCASCSIKLAVLKRSIEASDRRVQGQTASISTVNHETQVVVSLSRQRLDSVPRYDQASSMWDFGPSTTSQTVYFPTITQGQTPGGIPKLCLLKPDPSFQRSLQWAQDRINKCFGLHRECQFNHGSSFLPTRLIDVDPDMNGDVLLQHNSVIPEGSRYIALSYCWGDYQPDCLTTRASLQDHMTRMPWSTLPATFQDAVLLTRKLRMKYLWIDSVCIIQGDVEDWRAEAGRMFHVYKNSYLTLAALFGSNPTTGLRARGTLGEHQPCLVADVTFHGERYPLYMSRTHPRVSDWGITSTDPELSSVTSSAPLLTRAWTYQERIISPRVLFFTENEVIYECLKETSCECGAISTQEGFVQVKHNLVVGDRAKVETPTKVEASQSQHTAVSPEDTYQKAWYNIVNNYSALRLTVTSDKLPAVAAIAEQLQLARPGERYLSGLWSNTLHEDLLWRARSQNPIKKGRTTGIPTWSWASLQSAVGYDSWAVAATKEVDAEVAEVSCKYVEGNLFGILESSHLVLNGRLLSCKAQYSEPKKRFAIIVDSGAHNFSYLSDDKNHYIYLDETFDEFLNLQPIAILQIATFVQRRPSRLYILLRPESRGEETVYSRLGIFNYFYYGDPAPLEERFYIVFERNSVTTACALV